MPDALYADRTKIYRKDIESRLGTALNDRSKPPRERIGAVRMHGINHHGTRAAA